MDYGPAGADRTRIGPIADEAPMTADDGPISVDLAHEPEFMIAGLSVRPPTREVRWQGGEDILEPRVMQVLVVLARGRDAVISRDDLVQACWSGRIVGDDAVYRCIAKVRRLGEASGAFTLETIPRVGYRLADTEPEVAPTRAAPLAPSAPEPILAVLPFDNLSGDNELLFFSDGVSEEILHALSRNTNLKLIGRASSFQFRAPNKVVRVIAGELKTSHLLDGSVRRAGERVRVSAHLIEAATQTIVWSDRFDRHLSDVFALQDEIAAAVAAALDIRFAPKKKPSPVSMEAYDLFLRGSVWSRDVSAESQVRALALLEEAVAHAPTLARAWGELALARAQLRYLGAPEGHAIAVASIHDAAERALALDPRSQGAWGALFLATPPFEFLQAEALFARVRSAGFDMPLAQAIHFMDVGRIRAAQEELQRAQGMDPFLQMQLFYCAVDELANGRLENALKLMREASDRWPHVPVLSAYAALWAAHAGDWAEVERVMQPARLAQFPMTSWTQSVGIKVAALRGGAPRDLFARLRKAEASAGTSLAEALAFCAEVAGPDAVLKEPAPINASAVRRPELGVAAFFLPLYGALRRDKRFPHLCARTGLARYWSETGFWPDCADEMANVYDLRAECLKALKQLHA